jgi:hypothetical protein
MRPDRQKAGRRRGQKERFRTRGDADAAFLQQDTGAGHADDVDLERAPRADSLDPSHSLDDRLCLEVMALRGSSSKLRRIGGGFMTEKGSKQDQLVLSPVRHWKENRKS